MFNKLKKVLYIASLLFITSSCKRKELIVSKSAIASHSISETKFIKASKKIDYDLYYREAWQYCQKNNLNEHIFILIDLGVHSGLKRFFIYDFKKNKVLKSFMVSHGCGNSSWGETFTKDSVQVSNEPDSHCSSIGKYIILNRGISQWGIKVNYLLQGKDKTNSNALSRAIVLHSWEEIPNEEIYPKGTPEGWGCPAVSNESMKEIDSLLRKNKNKKILLWSIKT